MMTTVESGLNVQLLQDLRQKYPEVAEHVITSCVRQVFITSCFRQVFITSCVRQVFLALCVRQVFQL